MLRTGPVARTLQSMSCRARMATTRRVPGCPAAPSRTGDRRLAGPELRPRSRCRGELQPDLTGRGRGSRAHGGRGVDGRIRLAGGARDSLAAGSPESDGLLGADRGERGRRPGTVALAAGDRRAEDAAGSCRLSRVLGRRHEPARSHHRRRPEPRRRRRQQQVGRLHEVRVARLPGLRRQLVRAPAFERPRDLAASLRPAGGVRPVPWPVDPRLLRHGHCVAVVDSAFRLELERSDGALVLVGAAGRRQRDGAGGNLLRFSGARLRRDGDLHRHEPVSLRRHRVRVRQDPRAEKGSAVRGRE